MTLRTATFFDDLSDAELAEIEASGTTETHATGSVIFAEGDQAAHVYVLLRGRVGISRKTGESGSSIEITEIRPGEAFGELALFDGAPRSATATALEPLEVFVLGRDAFFRFLSRSPHTISRIFSRLSSKIREGNERFLAESIEKERVRTELERERYRSLAELVAGIAHEINTPLGIVRTATSIISESLGAIEPEKLDAAMKGVIDDTLEASALIDANLSRVNKLVQSFKNLSASQVVDQLEETDLLSAIDEAVTLFQPVARRAHLTIDVTSSRQPMPWTGYRGFLGQILLNLLSNIDRYAYANGEGGRIEIRVEDEDANTAYRVTVRDFGAGIARDDLGRIFDPFFTTGRARGGTGLGMSIVHNLVVSAMKGRIEIQSEPGKGTAVIVTLPREVAPSLSPS